MDNNEARFVYQEILDAMVKDFIVKMQPTREAERSTYNMFVAAEKAGIPLAQLTTMLSEYSRLEQEGKANE